MELLPSVFLGDKSFAGNLEWIRTNSIGAIVNVTWEVRNFFEAKKGSSDSLSITSSNDGINMNISSSSQSSELVLQDSIISSVLKEEKEEERRATPDSLPADDNRQLLSEELKETDEGSSSPSIKREENEEELLPICATTSLVDSSSSSPPSISLTDIPDILYKRVPVTDSQETKLDAFFDETADFISAQVREGKKVLVHCQLGMSRSPSILIAYAIRSLGMTLSSAVESISKSTLNINDGFQRQLMQYELKKLGLDVNTHDFFGKRSRTSFVDRYTPTSPLVPQKKKNGESKKQKKQKKKENRRERDNKEEKRKKRKNPVGGKVGENQSLLSFSSQTLSVIDHNGVVLSSTPTTRKEDRNKEKKKKKKKRSTTDDISKSPKKKQKNSTTNAATSLSVLWSSPSRTRTTSNSSKTSQNVASMPSVLFDTNPTPTSPKKSKSRVTPKSSPLTPITESTPTPTKSSLDSAPSTTSQQPDLQKTVKTQQPPLKRASSGAVTILDLIQAGVLVVGDEISFRGEVTKLLEDGTMNYKGQLFTSVSKWATTVIRTTGGSQNSQVNGWRCISVRYNKPLADLRDLYQKGKLPISPPPPPSSTPSSSTNSSTYLTFPTSTTTTQPASTEQGAEKTNNKKETRGRGVLKEEVEVMELQQSKQERLSVIPDELQGDMDLKVKEFEEVEDSEKDEEEESEDDESDSDGESESESSDSEEVDSSEEESEEEEEEEQVNIDGENKKEFISLMDGFGLAVEAEDSPEEEEEEVLSITSPSSVLFSPTRDSPSDSSASLSSTTTQVFLTSPMVEMQDEEEGELEEEDRHIDTIFLEENADSGDQGSTEEHFELSAVDADDIVNQMLSFE